MSLHHVADGFNKQVDSYISARPSYPPEAIQHAVDVSGLLQGSRVVDVAAGTGKLTQLLVQYGFDLSAVEPAPGMRQGFSKVLPSLPIIDGLAGSLPLPDSCVDALFVGQAFHWFGNREALQDFHRVLRPGGHLILIWNLEDDRIPWIKNMRALYEAYEGDAPQFRHQKWQLAFQNQPYFPFPTLTEYTNILHSTREQVWQRTLSKSYIANLPPEQQQLLKIELLAQLNAENPVFPTDPGAEAITQYTYRTFLYIAKTNKGETNEDSYFKLGDSKPSDPAGHHP